ncbi:MAG TPA: methyltransferase domain-containing protein [Acidimicrobiales bacterium]|nr:methyltransferase domain-containing protein [Acidimicrobiales bacterium]
MTAIADPAADWSAVSTAWDERIDYIETNHAAPTNELLSYVSAGAGDRVLELAAGPGVLGATWSERVGPTGHVVVSDVAPGMVEVARERNRAFANVEVTVLDLAAIDQPDESFDVVACRMGLMFAPQPGKALDEIRRVLRPGGRLGVLTWGEMQHNPWMTCVGMAAMINGVVAGGPPTGAGGIFSLGDPSIVASLARDAGFADVAAREIATSFQAATIDEHVERVSSLAGPLAAAFGAATSEQLAAVRKTAAELAAPYATSDGFELPGRAVLLTASA